MGSPSSGQPTAHRGGTAGPYSRDDLLDGLRTSGVRAGDTLMVHAAISSVGWTTGGGVALVTGVSEALTDAL